MKRADLDAALEYAPVLTKLTGKQQGEVEEILKHPGLLHIYGLMLGSRQALYAALADARLANAEAVGRASVLQGTIKGIEHFRHTLVELTVPDEQNEEQKA